MFYEEKKMRKSVANLVLFIYKSEILFFFLPGIFSAFLEYETSKASVNKVMELNGTKDLQKMFAIINQRTET